MMRACLRSSRFLFFILLLAAAARGATFVVTNTSDSGPGTLRQAITNANYIAGADTITFPIPGAGVHTISLASALPTITDPAVIDASTQPGYANQPLIELNAAANLIQGNLIGLNAAGTSALGNTNNGVLINCTGPSATGNRIGGSDPTHLLVQAVTWNLNVDIPQLRLDSGLTLASGQFIFRVSGTAPQGFVIETAMNLTRWQALSTNTLTGGLFWFTNAAPLASTPEFFRALILAP